jgi:predicted dehydrogenase
MGDVASVSAFYGTLTHPDVEVEDTAVAALRFKNGALGVLECSVCQDPGLFSRITIHGDNGASASLLEQPEGMAGVNDIWTIPGEEEDARRWLQEETGISGFPRFHHLQIQEFLQAAAERRDPAVTGEAGRRSVALILAIYESARTGQVVQL